MFRDLPFLPVAALNKGTLFCEKAVLSLQFFLCMYVKKRRNQKIPALFCLDKTPLGRLPVFTK